MISAPGPIEPEPTGWQFPPVDGAGPDDLVAVGADLRPGTLLAAYRGGYFPMPLDRGGAIGWWSPEPRAIIEPAELRVSRSLRQNITRFDIRIDHAFDTVIERCADPRRPHGWISEPVRHAYRELHRLGWAHSVEAWDESGLAGGLYGVSIGSFFAGESMFHRARDASKVALVALVEILAPLPAALLDVQWSTPHLESLGATEVHRATYLQRLQDATRGAPPAWTELAERHRLP